MGESALLFALRVRGPSSAQALGMVIGVGPEVVDEVLQALARADLVGPARRGDQLWDLTNAGEHRVAALVDTLPFGPSQELAGAYEGFLKLDTQVKQLCTDWQFSDGGVSAPYADRLLVLDAEVVPVFHRASQAIPRFGRYSERLRLAYSRFEGGDRSYLTDPRVDSYHSVWFEAHEDFLLCLGLEREDL